MESGKLTNEQLTALEEYRSMWETFGLSTQPAACSQAESGVLLLYRAAGLQPPAQIIWTESPEATAHAFRRRFTRTVYNRNRLDVETGDTVRRRLHNLGRSTYTSIQRRLSAAGDVASAYAGSDHLHTLFRDRIWQRVGRLVGSGSSENKWLWDYWGSIPNPGGGRILAHVHGQHDASAIGIYACYRDVFGWIDETEPWLGQFLLAQSANWWLPLEDTCWISDRPKAIHFDPNHDVHRADGPAVEYRDEWGPFCWHGVTVPKDVVLRPDTITPQRIEHERNIEIRRVMLERYGEARYIRDSDAEIIHEDRYGTLYRHYFSSDEPLVMLRVVNRSREADGSSKHYWLRVPPTMRTAHEAVAWTFGVTPEQYSPQIES